MDGVPPSGVTDQGSTTGEVQALSQSDLMRLLESLRTADGVETIRMLCERILQELIEAETTEVIGGAPYEHSDQRKTWRNGHRDRLLTTQAGDVDLKIPKMRTGSVFPSLLERRRRIDRALFAVEPKIDGARLLRRISYSQQWAQLGFPGHRGQWQALRRRPRRAGRAGSAPLSSALLGIHGPRWPAGRPAERPRDYAGRPLREASSLADGDTSPTLDSAAASASEPCWPCAW
jgi:mutator family transposase